MKCGIAITLCLGYRMLKCLEDRTVNAIYFGGINMTIYADLDEKSSPISTQESGIVYTP